LQSLVLTRNAVQGTGPWNADSTIINLLSASFPALLTLDVSQNFILREAFGYTEKVRAYVAQLAR
jgi:hypothetical protein